jgi:hypothetical protein
LVEDAVATEGAGDADDVVGAGEVAGADGVGGTEEVVTAEGTGGSGARGPYVTVVPDESVESAAEQEANIAASATTPRTLRTVIIGSPAPCARAAEGTSHLGK